MQGLAPIVIFAVQELIKYYPQLRTEIAAILTKSDATEADWLALQLKYQRKAYEDVVTESGLIASK